MAWRPFGAKPLLGPIPQFGDNWFKTQWYFTIKQNETNILSNIIYLKTNNNTNTLDCQIEVYACLFILHFCHPEHTLLGPALISILRSNAILHVNRAHCKVSRLVRAVDMLYFSAKNWKIIHVCNPLFVTTACLNAFGKKSLPCIIFDPALTLIFPQWATLHLCSGLHLMNFPTMCHPTLVFVLPLVFGSSEYYTECVRAIIWTNNG